MRTVGLLIMSNTFAGTAPTSGHVAPDELVMYGGTDNEVWGNTFLDPPGVTHSYSGSYAGIAMAESRAWHEIVRDVLKRHEVKLVTYVPDNVLRPLIEGIHAA